MLMVTPRWINPSGFNSSGINPSRLKPLLRYVQGGLVHCLYCSFAAEAAPTVRLNRKGVNELRYF